MAFNFSVPALPLRSVYEDYRDNYKGGYGWRYNINTSGIQYIAIHHTVTNPKNNLKSEVDEVFNIHTKTRGWGGIGYNFIVSTEVDPKTGFARCAYVGDLGNARAHTPNKKGAFGIRAGYGNQYIIGISIVGNFVNSQPSPAQLKTLHHLCKELIEREDKRLPNLTGWDKIKKHSDFDPTACCGTWDLKLIQEAGREQPVKPTTPPAVQPPVEVIDYKSMYEAEKNKRQISESQLAECRSSLESIRKEYEIAKDTYHISSQQQIAEIEKLQKEIKQLQTDLDKLKVELRKKDNKIDELARKLVTQTQPKPSMIDRIKRLFRLD